MSLNDNVVVDLSNLLKSAENVEIRNEGIINVYITTGGNTNVKDSDDTDDSAPDAPIAEGPPNIDTSKRQSYKVPGTLPVKDIVYDLLNKKLVSVHPHGVAPVTECCDAIIKMGVYKCRQAAYKVVYKAVRQWANDNGYKWYRPLRVGPIVQ